MQAQLRTNERKNLLICPLLSFWRSPDRLGEKECLRIRTQRLGVEWPSAGTAEEMLRYPRVQDRQRSTDLMDESRLRGDDVASQGGRRHAGFACNHDQALRARQSGSTAFQIVLHGLDVRGTGDNKHGRLIAATH